ncbi:MAG: FG-GAP-like repeat-containing protein [Thermoanaerobaculia bacterium]
MSVRGLGHDRPLEATARAQFLAMLLRRNLPSLVGILIVGLCTGPSRLVAQNCPTPEFVVGADLPFGPTGSSLGIWAADLNDDGRLDLVAVDDETVRVAMNLGHGHFSEARSVAVGGSSTVLGDFNGDGYPDLVTTRDQMIRLLLGDGSGGFRDAGSFGFFGSFDTLVAGDFDGDGRLDVAWVWEVAPSGRLVVAFGDGHGGFPRIVTTDFKAGETARRLRAIDFNGDGRTDLVSTYSPAVLSSTTGLLLSNGDGTFAPGPIVAGHQFYAASDAIPVDLNGDGIVDLLAMTSFKIFSWNVCGALLDGKGGIAWSPACQGISNIDLSPFALADFTGDGKADLAFADGVSILVAAGDGSGLFGPFMSFPAGTDGRTIFAADLDGDGRPDIVVGPSARAPARWLANTCRIPGLHRPATPGPAIPVRPRGRVP